MGRGFVGLVRFLDGSAVLSSQQREYLILELKQLRFLRLREARNNFGPDRMNRCTAIV